MPYRRRSYGRSRRPRNSRYSRRRYKKTTYGAVKSMATNGFYLAKKLARLVNVEKKLHELSLGSTAATTSGLLWPIAHNTASYPANAITQGSGYAAREGMSVKPMFLKISGSMWTNTALAAGARLRIIIFQHKNANDQTIFPTSYLNSASVTSFKSWSNRFHFKTLFDATYNLNANSTEIKGIDIKRKLYGHITYTENSDLIENGAYYVLALADSNTAVNFAWNMRLTYVDN